MTVFADHDHFPPFGPWETPGAGAGALVYAVDAEARVLMQLRDDRPHLAGAGFWAPFGGGVEAGETLRQAALREFEEETGLILSEADLRPFGRALSRTSRRAKLYAFAARMPGPPEAVRLGEGAGFALFTARQLASLSISPAVREMTLHLAGLIEAAALPEAADAPRIGLRPPKTG